jgi:c-di-GMP-binding flagellar brake protein YcgR
VEGERQERKEVQLPVSFIGDARGGGTVRNLSSDGCKIESESQILGTQLLVLRISVPHEISPIVIDVAAVRWSKSPTCGVQFISMKEAEQQRLDRYLVTLSPS